MRRVWTIASTFALILWQAPASARKNPFLYEPEDAEKTPAFQYATLSSEECLKKLEARGVPFEQVEPTRGVQTPIRFTGAIRGVTFRPTYRTQPDEKAPATIADCRLALAIDDLASVLAQNGVVEVEYLSMYRRRGLGFMRPGIRHPGGRAIDIALFRLNDGRVYSVHGDFHGRAGQKTCGEKAAPPTKDTPGARFLRSVACTLGEKRSFNLVLTPHYDWGHRDHFHLEVRSGIKWFLIQ